MRKNSHPSAGIFVDRRMMQRPIRNYKLTPGWGFTPDEK